MSDLDSRSQGHGENRYHSPSVLDNKIGKRERKNRPPNSVRLKRFFF